LIHDREETTQMPASASTACDASGARWSELGANRSERVGPAAALPLNRPPLPPAWLVIASLIVAGRPDEVRTARQFIGQAMGDEHPRAGDALLLGSELVTNAVVHSRSGMPGGTVLVVVAQSPRVVHILVTDEGSADCQPQVAGMPGTESGNGLLLVEALADGWGYLGDTAFTTVWFSLLAAP
jgi:anti-sigma regulatory factor (Ser/Thr protein kinase)